MKTIAYQPTKIEVKPSNRNNTFIMIVAHQQKSRVEIHCLVSQLNEALKKQTTRTTKMKTKQQEKVNPFNKDIMTRQLYLRDEVIKRLQEKLLTIRKITNTSLIEPEDYIR